ncbi:MAG: dihydropteroate synthase [Aeromonadaceae bacterium]|nr:dihydropteroate synthase [Aeromonadaceae bacterium]
MLLHSKGRSLDLSRPQVMGILNVTPDSFSDGSRYQQLDVALRHASQMVQAGATLIDIGGESTRPGAAEVPLEQELERVVPVVERLAAELDVWLSVDTYKAEVMRAAMAAGAHLINDIRALEASGALAAAAEAQVPVCLMHMQGAPRTMQQAPHYENLLGEVHAYFAQRIAACVAAGIPRERLILDPGFGFGKTLDQNYELLARLDEFADFQLPLLVGMSRKSMVGQLLERPVEARLAGSLALALYASRRGAHIIRVHDVQETVDALRIFSYADQFRTQR